jgi:nitroreductase
MLRLRNSVSKAMSHSRFISNIAPGSKVRSSSIVKPDDADAFTRIVEARVTNREFDSSRPVAPEIIERILRLTQRAPSSLNFQPYKFIVINTDESKTTLGNAMTGGNADRVRKAPFSVVFLADMQPALLSSRVAEVGIASGIPPSIVRTLVSAGEAMLSGEAGPAVHDMKVKAADLASNIFETNTVNTAEGWAFKNTALAASYFMLACSAHGLVTNPMEGFSVPSIQKALNIPKRYSVLLVVSCGYEPANAPGAAKSGRFELEEVAYSGSFGVPLK